MDHDYEITKINAHPELIAIAAKWFSEKWRVPLSAYTESMNCAVQGAAAVPQWYVIREGGAIIAGIGVIENDFHDRKDLRPNVCAVYVEEPYRNRGIAGKMLQFVADEMHNKGIDTLYLITDHTGFYERYGWQFLCMVQGDGEPDMTRMYVHRA